MPFSSMPKVDDKLLGRQPAGYRRELPMTEEAARSLNLKLQILEVLRRDEVGDVIRAACSSQTEALNILSSPFLASVTRDTVAFAAEYRLLGANICDVFCVANAGANSDTSVDTEPLP